MAGFQDGVDASLTGGRVVLRRGWTYSPLVMLPTAVVSAGLLWLMGWDNPVRSAGVLLVVVAAAWYSVAWFAYRTVIEPKGIRDRTPFGEVFIPWRRVTAVATKAELNMWGREPLVGKARDIFVHLKSGAQRRLEGARGARPRRGPTVDEVITMIQAGIDSSHRDHTEPDATRPGTGR